MIPWGPIFVLICMVALPVHYWRRMFAEDPKYGRRWIITWFIRGVVLPIVVWAYLNAGAHPIMPAFARPSKVPSLQLDPTLGALPFSIPGLGNNAATPATLGTAPPNASWFERTIKGMTYVSRQSRPAIVVISSYWAALTMGWFVVLKARRTKDVRSYAASSVVWCLLASPLFIIMLLLFGWGSLGFASLIFVWPLMHQSSLLAAKQAEKPVLSYGGAVGRLKFGKYREAEAAIIAELEKSESDFEGWMMLAELYARQFDDIGEAERTIMDICRDPNTTLPDVAVALNRLADWQLQLKDDPMGARRALEEIRRRMPGSHLARMAAMRIDRLPSNSAELAEQRALKKYQLPAVGDTIDDAVEYKGAAAGEIAEPLMLANRCVERLRRDPNDVATREKLARIFAEQMSQVDLALEQIELLVEMPEQPEKKVAEWLGMMAAWQLRYRGNREAGKKLLQRIIREFPQSVQAFAAQRRLSLLEMEERVQTAPAPVVGKIEPTVES